MNLFTSFLQIPILISIAFFSYFFIENPARNNFKLNNNLISISIFLFLQIVSSLISIFIYKSNIFVGKDFRSKNLINDYQHSNGTSFNPKLRILRQKNYAILGNSHADMLIPMFDYLFKERDEGGSLLHIY